MYHSGMIVESLHRGLMDRSWMVVRIDILKNIYESLFTGFTAFSHSKRFPFLIEPDVV